MTSLFQKLTSGKKEASDVGQKKKTLSFSSQSPTFIGGSGDKEKELAAAAADLADLYMTEDSVDTNEPQQQPLSESFDEYHGVVHTTAVSSISQSKVSHSSSLNSNTSGYVTNSNSNSSESQHNGKRPKLESVNSIMDELLTLNNNGDEHETATTDSVAPDCDADFNGAKSEECERVSKSGAETYYEIGSLNNANSQLSKFLTTPLNAATISTTPMMVRLDEASTICNGTYSEEKEEIIDSNANKNTSESNQSSLRLQSANQNGLGNVFCRVLELRPKNQT